MLWQRDRKRGYSVNEKVNIQHDCYQHEIGEYDSHVVKRICVDVVKSLCGHYYEGYEVQDSGMSRGFRIVTPYLNYTVNDIDRAIQLTVSVDMIPIDKHRMGFKGVKISFSQDYREWRKIKQRYELYPIIDDKCGNYHYYIDPDKMLAKLKTIEVRMLDWNIKPMPPKKRKDIETFILLPIKHLDGIFTDENDDKWFEDIATELDECCDCMADIGIGEPYFWCSDVSYGVYCKDCITISRPY